MKITKYYIINEWNLDIFHGVMNTMLSDGWQPYGNLAVAVDRDRMETRFYIQPMIKSED